MSKGQSQPRTHPGRRAFGRCKNKTIEIIDVDKGKADVVIIDAPESSQKGSGCSWAKSSSSPAAVIHIDDEEGDIDDTPSNAGQSFLGNRACPGFGNHPLDEELVNDEYLIFLRKGHSSSDFCGKASMHPALGSSRSRYGLFSYYSKSSLSESDSSERDTSESDSSDCEIMEDSSGLIREQWERAALRKKMSQTVRGNSEDQASASGSSADPGFSSAETTRNMVNSENCTNESFSEHLEVLGHKPGPGCSNSRTNLTSKLDNGVELNRDPFLGINRKDSPADSNTSTGISCEGPIEKENTISESSIPGAQFFENHVDFSKTSTPDIQMQGDVFNHMDKAVKDPSRNSSSMNTFRVETIQEEGMSPGKPSEAWDGKNLVSDSVGIQNQKEDVLHTHSPHDTPVDHEVSAETKEKSFVEQMPPFTEPLHDEPQIKHGSDCFTYNMEAIHGESTSRSNAGTGASKKILSLHTDTRDLSQRKGEVIGGLEKHNECAINHDVSQLQSDITGEREKHKESDEYRRADEEEWASRKREIQIQAEEAQRLRKRIKAESLRLLDMEKRQKQRVEEIRESQRKDEEIINLKEVLRAEVRKELDKMEVRYRDMASLLRGLGIHVEGGPFPLSHEVNAAYKQALLRFHPDRASKTDIRQQVEAEETFKMISRLKEKLLPVA